MIYVLNIININNIKLYIINFKTLPNNKKLSLYFIEMHHTDIQI